MKQSVKIMQTWYYNEFQPTGLDYSDVLNVESYDRQMQRFRDYKKEAAEIMKLLDLAPEAHILEIGTGTGHFAIEAAGVYKNVTAFDTSKNMLAYAEQKASKLSRSNIIWFLATYTRFWSSFGLSLLYMHIMN